MKLLFVLPEYGPSALGGIATFYNNLLPALVRLGHTVDVVIASPFTQAKELGAQHGIAVRQVDQASGRRAQDHWSPLLPLPHLRSSLGYASAAWELASGGDGYDLVETTDYGMLFVPWVGRSKGPPVVVQLHGSNGQVDYHDPIEGQELSGLVCRLYESALLGRADGLQTYGRPNAMEWSALLGRSVEHIWPAWQPPTPESGLPDLPPAAKNGPYGVVVGRIQCWKGVEVLCEAVSRLPADSPPILWVGDPKPYRRPDRLYSDYLAETFPEVWGSRVIPVGSQSRAVTARLQAEAQFVVVPSTWDVFNLAAVEAMAVAKPVICSDGAGAADLIRHGENGFRFRSGDAAELANLLGLVSQSDEATRGMGEAASRTIRDLLAPDQVAAARAERYAAVAKANRRPAHPWAENGFVGLVPPGDPLAFLGSLPLRDLVRYGIRRAANRLRRKR
jgi:glycosyltransferase involved in cell wall biosynthesis